ncbi:c-type cytochrome [Aquimarina pacifica]|uniref:c-type cytochrome n=1 Tax=Aquimarina pacifica TaxID=1296415 RepID=UPI0004BBD92D|nr:hypothetical protein [Aquimarina pacifica]
MKKTLLILVASIAFLACENNVEEETGNEQNDTPEQNDPDTDEQSEVCDTTISFSDDVKSIIDTNCIGCHGGSRFPDLRTYENISINAQNIRGQVVSRRMPQGGSLTNDEIELIKCWIDSGALDN